MNKDRIVLTRKDHKCSDSSIKHRKRYLIKKGQYCLYSLKGWYCKNCLLRNGFPEKLFHKSQYLDTFMRKENIGYVEVK